MADFEELAVGLRAWAAGNRSDEAAVELLVWHETWLRRADFTSACVLRIAGGTARIGWQSAREFIGRQPRASTSELVVLDLAVTLGEDRFRLPGLGRRHRRMAAEAFAHACGQSLEGEVPEVGHSHPDFIPGTPETCTRCAIDAGDEGRR